MPFQVPIMAVEERYYIVKTEIGIIGKKRISINIRHILPYIVYIIKDITIDTPVLLVHVHLGGYILYGSLFPVRTCHVHFCKYDTIVLSHPSFHHVPHENGSIRFHRASSCHKPETICSEILDHVRDKLYGLGMMELVSIQEMIVTVIGSIYPVFFRHVIDNTRMIKLIEEKRVAMYSIVLVPFPQKGIIETYVCLGRIILCLIDDLMDGILYHLPGFSAPVNGQS